MTKLDRMIVAIGPGDIAKLDRLPASFQMAAMIMARLKKGRLDITVPDGRTLRFQGKEAGPQAEMVMHDPRLTAKVLTRGDIGFAEAYMDGKFDTPDLARVLEYFVRNFEDAGALAVGGRLTQIVNLVRHAFRANTKRGSKRNILAHYDLGNEFYSRWLDPTMTYSSAIYSSPDQTLEQAQLAKYRAIASELGLAPGKHVLEIGSGWGGFAEVAAGEYGARVTSITISDAQHAYACERMARAGLSDLVDIQMRDYRDITGQFDAVASIEMFEAVGEKYWPAYFGKVADSLKPGGKADLQIITIEDDQFDNYRQRPDFIQHYIFPGGMLISPERIRQQAERIGLAYRIGSQFGMSYARTLAEWTRRFQKAWDGISRLGFDDRFRRLWLYYLAYCEAGFCSGRIDVGQFVLSKPPTA